ncbi:MAG: polyphosphate kinase 2 family protein [Bacteroidota bacterium]|nr:polyphosphate kinase 2 family protein [Bacteroidota bacterium]MDP4252039.1 polyphosphate kinase 2 family protein [Bacteroidota bacterium]
MINQQATGNYADKYRIPEGKSVSLKERPTDEDDKPVKKDDGDRLLQSDILQLTELQEKLYANGRYSVLIIIQAMDAGGKDSVVKHVMSGLNPQGVNVTSFKTPTHQELAHDYLWRHYIALPGRGMVGIFNRSHYENVLVTRVHPEYILNENIPGISSVENIDKSFWEKRFKQINHFERTLTENGTIILKFHLHVSKKEQKKRFLERIDDPAKNWKFSSGDLKERALWKDYRKAYEDMLENTSTDISPWFTVPADDKWFTRLVIANIIVNELSKLDLRYPVLSTAQRTDLAKAKTDLLGEE